MYKLIIIYCLLLLPLFINAQESPVASGGDASGEGGKASYSVGQVFYSIGNGSNGSVNEGVQQPYDIEVTFFIDKALTTINCNVFPNPAGDIIKLSIEDLDLSNLQYSLRDIEGKLLLGNKIQTDLTEISLEPFSSSTYLLIISENNKPIKSFQIIKN